MMDSRQRTLLGRDGKARDPRELTAEELIAAGHPKRSLTKVIRAKCLDCCGAGKNAATEVKLCSAVECPLWPFRLGGNPLRNKVEISPEKRAAMAENLRLARQRASEPPL